MCRIPLAFVGILSCFAICGCGSSGPYDYVPVNGIVTYEDGSPIAGECRLLFIALDAPTVAGAVPRAAQANVDSSGRFDCVTSYKYGDGLIPGRHKVVIESSGVRNGRQVFPASCLSADTTPLMVDTENLPLEIKVPRSL
jgi:hypothetical protein